MKPITLHWKFGNPLGLRVFGSTLAAQQAGEDVSNLYVIGGMLVKWPESLGPVPDDATVQTWDQEHEAEKTLEDKRQAALKALQDKAWQDALDAAVNDPDAPQAVKDYRNAKK